MYLNGVGWQNATERWDIDPLTMAVCFRMSDPCYRIIADEG